MKKSKLIILILVLILITITVCLTIIYTTKNNLVVATYNIDAKKKNDHNAQRELLEDEEVDIFGLQEVNFENERFADENIHKYNSLTDFKQNDYIASYFGNAMDFAQGGYGVAIISKFDFIETDTVHLPISESVRPIEPRVFSRAVIKFHGKKVAFYCTHLSYEEKDLRKHQMEVLKNAMKQDDADYVIAVGDFNTNQATTEFEIWKDDFNIANGKDGIWIDTYSKSDNSMNIYSIDNIITSKNIEITNVRVIKSDLSDHFPLIADLYLR